MTSQRTTTYLARSLRLQRLVRVTLLVLILGQLLTAHAVAADNKTTPAADERPVITQTNLRELPKLIEQGADVNQHIWLCREQGAPYFPLDAATESWAYGNRARFVKSLLDRGAKIRGNEITNAAFHPGRRQALTMVKTLLDAGADPNGKPGKPALTRAAFRGHTELVTLLLAQPGIQVDARDIDGYSALMHAASNGHTMVVELLLKAGANPDVVSKRNGTTAASLVQGEIAKRQKILSMIEKETQNR